MEMFRFKCQFLNFIYLQCYLNVVPSPPIAIIRGGNQRVARQDRDLTISGEDSINVDCAEGSESCFLYYQWRCSGIPFCNGFTSEENAITIPKDKLQNGVTIKAALKVQSPLGSAPKVAIQVIKITDQKIPTLEIM